MTSFAPAPVRPVRCAIYTRKSTEDGLDQEFNSLDAQREACAAYVLSQRHEGWTLLPSEFDDGGYSGGNMERPGLKRLLDEVKARRIDVIIVYKIDRLTRSLGDFARIVEVLDTAGASFVSITQAFNTTTSMGRLTLNMLLSFAQFEREVTSERIRDKIAASKARGMWMGGVVPLGYEVRDRELVVVEYEAETVRRIFKRYLALGSAVALQEELDRDGICSKRRVTISGREYGGARFSRGALYALLQNRLYIGEVTHRGTSYPGRHVGIIDVATFDAAQAQLQRNRADRLNSRNASHPSPLAGLVWDAHGRRLSPTHSTKQTRHYRYYVSRTDGENGHFPVWRIPASDLEELVIGRIRAFLLDPGAIQESLTYEAADASTIAERLHSARQLARELDQGRAHDLRETLLMILRRVTIGNDHVRVCLDRKAIRVLGHRDVSGERTADLAEEAITLVTPAARVRVGKEVRLVIPPLQGGTSGRRDPALIKLVVKAQAARASLEANEACDLATLARSLGYSRDYFSVLLRVGYLAPDIVRAILDGRQPASLNRQKLARCPIPLGWDEQRLALGFSYCSLGNCSSSNRPEV